MDQSQTHIARAVPKSLQITPERIVKLALMAATQRGSMLPQCSPVSVLKSLTDLAAVGLEPGTGPMAMAYLVPFRNGAQWEAQPVIGYRGYISLARRSGEFQDLHATVVYAKDEFDVDLGSSPRLVHKPYHGDGKDRGVVVGAYCVARFTNGGQQIEFMRRVDIEGVRDKFSKAAARGGPWRDNFEAMAVKTVIRRAAKHWPLSVELQDAIALEAGATVDAEPDWGPAGAADTAAESEPSAAAAAQPTAQQASAQDLPEVFPEPDEPAAVSKLVTAQMMAKTILADTAGQQTKR